MQYLFLLVLIAVMPLSGAAAYDDDVTPPPGNIYDAAPFSNATHFSSVNCGQTFSCSAYATAEDLLVLANQCSAQRLGFPEDMLIYFEPTGTYENCALPQTFISKETGSGNTSFWPICCVAPAGDQCQFVCHYYTGAGAQ